MADRRLVLSDLLCFVTNKFGRVEAKMLKTVIMDFYQPDDVLQAKWSLLDDINELHLDQTPRIPRRREGEKHAERDLDDIFTLLTFVDENKINSRLPLYVTDEPDRMPSLRLFEGDLKYFYKKLELFDSKMQSYGSAMAAMMSELRSHLSEWPALCPPASRSAEQQSTSKPSTAAAGTTRQPLNKHQPSWAAMTSSPSLHGNRFAALISTDDDHSDALHHDDAPLTVVSRRKKRMRQRGDTSPQLSGGSQSVSQPVNQFTRTEQQRSGSKQQQRAPVMFGKGVSSDGKVIAAGKLRKKAVYCLDNIKKGCTVDDIKSYVSKLSVEVYTCHKVKSRRRRGEEEPSEERSAFRLCIAADDRDRLLDPAVWPDSIVISEWFFKPQDRDSGNDDKRLRTDSTTVMNQQQHQSPAAHRQSPAAATAASARSAASCEYDDSTILATSMDYHDGC